MLTRRTFLTGLIAAPIVITTPGLLMPVKALAVPDGWYCSDEGCLEVVFEGPGLFVNSAWHDYEFSVDDAGAPDYRIDGKALWLRRVSKAERDAMFAAQHASAIAQANALSPDGSLAAMLG